MIELLVLLFIWMFEAMWHGFLLSWKVMCFCIKGLFLIIWSCVKWAFKIVVGAGALLIGFIVSVFFPSIGEKKKSMTGIDFENYCGKYLLTHGFHDVRTTPPSGDYGADLVAKDANGVTWVFQCKHYKSKVGNGCVQEVVAAKKHYGASKAAVMTNSQLTQKARELAIENEVILFECMD